MHHPLDHGATPVNEFVALLARDPSSSGDHGLGKEISTCAARLSTEERGAVVNALRQSIPTAHTSENSAYRFERTFYNVLVMDDPFIRKALAAALISAYSQLVRRGSHGADPAADRVTYRIFSLCHDCAGELSFIDLLGTPEALEPLLTSNDRNVRRFAERFLRIGPDADKYVEATIAETARRGETGRSDELDPVLAEMVRAVSPGTLQGLFTLLTGSRFKDPSPASRYVFANLAVNLGARIELLGETVLTALRSSEESTRSAALSVIATIPDGVPAALRRALVERLHEGIVQAQFSHDEWTMILALGAVAMTAEDLAPLQRFFPGPNNPDVDDALFRRAVAAYAAFCQRVPAPPMRSDD